MLGPVSWPRINSAPRRIAIEELPGTPKAIVDASAPPSTASFAASDPMTPSMFPLPKVSFDLDDCFAWPYATKAAGALPSPGISPIAAPMALHRMTSHQCRNASTTPRKIWVWVSFADNGLVCDPASEPPLTHNSNISATAKRPRMTGTSSRPSRNSSNPKVNLS